MFCNNCGQNLPPNSKFCNFCGANLTKKGSTHELIKPEAAAIIIPDEEERVIFTAQPTMLYVYVRYFFAGIVTLAIAIVTAIIHSKYNLSFAPLVAAILGLIVFLNPIYHHILRQREVYTLTNHKIEFTYGLLGKTTRNIPLTKIQDVTSTSSALERLLGIGDIVIDSAAEMGKIPLRKVNNPKALTDTILNQVRKQH